MVQIIAHRMPSATKGGGSAQAGDEFSVRQCANCQRVRVAANLDIEFVLHLGQGRPWLGSHQILFGSEVLERPAR